MNKNTFIVILLIIIKSSKVLNVSTLWINDAIWPKHFYINVFKNRIHSIKYSVLFDYTI